MLVRIRLQRSNRKLGVSELLLWEPSTLFLNRPVFGLTDLTFSTRLVRLEKLQSEAFSAADGAVEPAGVL